MNQRVRLRRTFDEDAQLYDEARPGYPEALFDDVVRLSGIQPGGRILEIGCGTGKATAPFARRGFRIQCVELGENMAAVAERNLASFPGVEVVLGDFETVPIEEGAFDLVFSATAIHWIKETIRYRKSARALKRGGTVAVFAHHHVRCRNDRGFFDEVQLEYNRIAPEIVDAPSARLLSAEDVVADEAAEIAETRLYGPVAVRRYQFEIAYDSQSYIQLLNTYSGHRSLRPHTRKRLFDAVIDLIETRYGGRIVKGYSTILCLADRA